MGFIEQITVSLKGREIDLWEELEEMYPNTSKHDIVFLGLKRLYKHKLKKLEEAETQ